MRSIGVLVLALCIGLAGVAVHQSPASAAEPLSADTRLTTSEGATLTALCGRPRPSSRLLSWHTDSLCHGFGRATSGLGWVGVGSVQGGMAAKSSACRRVSFGIPACPVAPPVPWFVSSCRAQARPPECRHLADFRPEWRPASNRNGWPASSEASSCSLEGQGCGEISARTGLQGCGCAHKEKCRAEAGPHPFHTNRTKIDKSENPGMERQIGIERSRSGRQQPLKGAREGRRREATRRRNCDTVASFVPHVRHMTYASSVGTSG
jgi:hypothetical protein